MNSQDTVRYLFVRLLIIDLVMGIAATIAWLASLDIHSVGGTVALCVSMFMLHVMVWVLPVYRALAPLGPWDARGCECSDAELLAADAAAERLPMDVARAQGLAWPVHFGGIAALAWFVFPEVLSFGSVELVGICFQFGALAVGPPVVIFPVVSLLLQDRQVELGAELGRRALGQSRELTLMGPRLIVAVVALVMANTFWMSSMLWLANGERERQVALVELREATRWSAHQVADGEALLDEHAELVTAVELAPTLELDGTLELGEVVAVLDRRHEQVTAAAPVGDGRWVQARALVVFNRSGYQVGLLGAIGAALFGSLLTIVAISRLISGPLGRLRSALGRVVEVGDLGAVGRIPVIRKDEIGVLTSEFNRMLDVFDELARAARAVAKGDLRVAVTGPGDLQDAFRAMVERLSELVTQIREAAIEVASAAAEIYAGTQGQEHAAGQQSDGIREVSVAMERLAASASNISIAASEVLDNAEQTRARSDEVVGKLGELGEHIVQVSELLELIREVADRSDLLALNGSLEATRAGEAGRGFALVAAEMRRLAERVTGTVTDVRATISDVGAANVATVTATQDSRELAESTARAARRIVEVTHSQSTETERVSAGVRDIAEVVTASVSATVQTRAAVDGLRERASRLERLIEHFDLRSPSEPGASASASASTTSEEESSRQR